MHISLLIARKITQVSLTLPPACRQPASCCDEWTSYGVSLLPKSSTGDVRRVNSYRTLPRARDADVAADNATGEAKVARYYGGTSNGGMSWCTRLGVGTPALGVCTCRLGSNGVVSSYSVEDRFSN